jgi:hypothetical protein
VRCDIRIINLDENSDYEALSYVWGDATELREIEVSGKPLMVTSNLGDALVHLRYPIRTRTLWIDQLCINQGDSDEKAAQVAMMRDIYRNCTHCILWLGRICYEDYEFGEEHIAAVFDFMKVLGAITEENLLAVWPHGGHGGCPCGSGIPTLFCEYYVGTMTRKAFAAFAAFAMYGNPWWERIWTLQESMLPRSADFVWGLYSISREEMIRVVQRLRRLASFPLEFQKFRKVYAPLLRCLT